MSPSGVCISKEEQSCLFVQLLLMEAIFKKVKMHYIITLQRLKVTLINKK